MSKSVRVALITIIFLGGIFVGYLLYENRLPSSLVPSPNPSRTASSTALSSAATSSEFVGHNGCGGCVLESDTGRTITLSPTSRITIELPAARYSKDALTIVPAGILGETFGAGVLNLGDWSRTFEAIQSGTAVLSVPGIQGQAPFTLNIVVH